MGSQKWLRSIPALSLDCCLYVNCFEYRDYFISSENIINGRGRNYDNDEGDDDVVDHNQDDNVQSATRRITKRWRKKNI